MNTKEHWEDVYENNSIEDLGWFRPRLETSLEWIREYAPGKDASIIDVGGGASSLTDDLAVEFSGPLTVVDISGKALSISRERLGRHGNKITWIDGDITSVPLPKNSYDFWHDRAVFHFLRSDEEQNRYKKNLLRALKPGGHLLLGAFSTEAPPRCSGLPVERYTREKIDESLGVEFQLRKYAKELHVTPGGVEQMYLYCLFQRSSPLT